MLLFTVLYVAILPLFCTNMHVTLWVSKYQSMKNHKDRSFLPIKQNAATKCIEASQFFLSSFSKWSDHFFSTNVDATKINHPKIVIIYEKLNFELCICISECVLSNDIVTKHQVITNFVWTRSQKQIFEFLLSHLPVCAAHVKHLIYVVFFMIFMNRKSKAPWGSVKWSYELKKTTLIVSRRQKTMSARSLVVTLVGMQE